MEATHRIAQVLGVLTGDGADRWEGRDVEFDHLAFRTASPAVAWVMLSHARLVESEFPAELAAARDMASVVRMAVASRAPTRPGLLTAQDVRGRVLAW